MCTGEYPYDGDEYYLIMERIKSGEYIHETPENLSDNMKDLINRLLDKKVSNRITVEEVLKRPEI
jgi:serine/threonine protein kinase